VTGSFEATEPSRLETLFDRALEVPSERRAAFLREHCADDVELRERLLAMLAQDEEGTRDYLLSPVSNAIDVERTDQLTNPVRSINGEEAEQVGEYRIIDVIGEGGMGRVFLAKAVRNPHRFVALKVMRPGASVARVASRFENERQVLGMMEHDNICSILDGGTTPQGLPYFVMEFVEGARPMTRYAFENNLDLRERLELFHSICEAVAHGHGKGILHRDLKPSNLLVGLDGVPKLIDFGIARSFDEYDRDTTHLTEMGQLLGTVRYMSPEQILGKPLDERSDVYSLGVILYELLTRHMPYDISGKSLVEAARIIEDEPPQRLSRLRIELQGDVETIVLKALQKESHRRYTSVAELAGDIDRFLGFKPIVARNPSLVYQASLFARRHTRLIGVLLLTFAALLVGVIVSVFWAIDSNAKKEEARLAAEEAKQAREEAEAVAGFLTRSLATVDPRRNSKVPTVERLVVHMNETMPEEFRFRPAIYGLLLNTFGRTYEALGKYEEAEALLSQAYATLNEEFGPDDPRTLRTLVGLSSAEHSLGRGRHAARRLEPLLPKMREILGEYDPDFGTALFSLGWIALNDGQYDKAEPLLLEARAVRERIFGEEDLRTLEVQDALAWAYDGQGRSAEGLELLRSVYDTQKRVWGEVNSEILNSLGLFYQQAGFREDASEMFELALNKDMNALGVDHPDTLVVMFNMGILFEENNRLGDAEGMLGEVSERQIDALGIDHPSTLSTLASLGRVKGKMGYHEEAEELLADVIERTRSTPERKGDLGVYLVDYGICLLELQKDDKAEETLLEAYETFSETWGPDTIGAFQAADSLVTLYRRQGHTERVEHWRSVADTARASE